MLLVWARRALAGPAARDRIPEAANGGPDPQSIRDIPVQEARQ